LKAGVTIETASADMTVVAHALAQEYPATNSGRGVTIEPLRDTLVGSDLRLTALLFLGVVGFVLLGIELFDGAAAAAVLRCGRPRSHCPAWRAERGVGQHAAAWPVNRGAILVRSRW
jgi:hypothetical protein